MSTVKTRVKGAYPGPFTGICDHENSIIEEAESDFVVLELVCCAHESCEVWNGISELVEKIDVELLEERGGYLTKKRIQVRMSTFERKPAKIRKGDMCQERCIHELLLNLTIRNRGMKSDPQCLQFGYERQLLEQFIWGEVRGWMDPSQ